jgi:hypothetical protein
VKPLGYPDQHNVHIQATVQGTGAVTATVLVEATLDEATMLWAPIYTVDLSGTTSASSLSVILGGAAKYRASVTAISGTGAAVSVRMD